MPEGRSAGPAQTAAFLRRAEWFYDRLPDPIFAVDDRRRCVLANRAACRAFGLPRAELLGRRMDDFVLSRLAGSRRKLPASGCASSARSLRGAAGRPATFETCSRANFMPGLHLSVLRDVGRHRAAECEIRRLADELEARVRERTLELERLNRRLAADLARRSAAESALRESERRYRGLFTHTNNAIVIFDPSDGRVLDANRSAARLYGYRKRDLVGSSLLDISDRRLWRRNVRLILRRGTVTNLEISRRRRDGRELILSINAATIEYADRRAILAILRDVTERRNVERALRESEQRLRAARDASLDAFYVEECVRNARGQIVDFRFVDVNRRAAELLHCRREDLVGRRVCKLFPAVRSDGFLRRFARVVETGRPLIEEFQVDAPKIVRAQWLQQQVVRLGDGVLLTARDITEKKRAEQALRHFSWRLLQAQEAERRRVARDLHDSVSQLLATARFRLQSAEAKLAGVSLAAYRDVSSSKVALAKALREVRRISHHLRPGELDDLGFTAAVRALCREFTRRTGVKVELSHHRLPGRPPPLLEETFYRIMQEGLTNIERHARARKVRITLAQHGGQVSLLMADDGCGFVPGRRPARGRNAGMGLHNMQERAAQAGGVFECRSRPKRGTEIRVRLPLKPGVVAA